MLYRRANAAGGTYFFTVNLADRSRRLLVERVDDLRVAVRTVRDRHPFEIVAWVVQIRDDDDLQRHVDYVHINPVKHGHARQASAWPYSSIHRYIRAGELAADWSAEPGLVLADGGHFGKV